ncbi:glutamyl-tRNA reductase [Zhihengliuella halotolerans]|uniref:Glutamyl-tRNA reductase n=1 Tax=Zhihengliuella halotolerans TaxID=370736 RepID=A0A4Q8AA96_9MICC|nr:glutamyl-tRNA reductase [Zhihengliuella halotolerans]RZU61030.1 glutamyl-tRNA reductase [Zhihengliuella halotolerans]
MVFVSLVASHSDVDLETVARLSAGASEVASGALDGTGPVSGAVVLATCNRYEVYAEARSEEDIEATRSTVISEIAELSGLDEQVVSSALTTLTGKDAVNHLFAVGAGLDSAVIGEREIAGQVRRALIEAQESGTASGPLVRLFQTASRTAKDVGSRTALGGRGLSIVSVALDLAEDLRDDAWAEKNVVVFGTGAYAGATMSLLQQRHAGNVFVYSNSGRASAFVATRGGTALTDETLADALRDADVVIGCSGGDHKLTAGDLAETGRGDAPLVAIDLALTRDFDVSLEELEHVDVVTLESVRMAAPAEQAAALEEAREIVLTAADEFAAEQRERSADAAIVALRKHTQRVLETEVERVRAQHGCTAAAEEVEFAMRRMMRQLLHEPTVRARELAAQGRSDEVETALSNLFGISTADVAAANKKAPRQKPQAAPAPAPAAMPDDAVHARHRTA